MHRVLAAFVAITLAAFVLVTPATVEAKPDGAKPRPTPTAKPTPTPTPTLLAGIDVSYHQGTIRWPQVAAAGKRFAFIRATAGTLTADTAYGSNRAGARAAGLTVGAYHYANPDSAPSDAVNEARWFLQHAAISSGDLRPVLDLEVSNGLAPSSLTTWAQTWLAEVTSATGVRPIIYTNASFWSTSMANTDWFARNGYTVLWIAHWTTASQPNVPAGGWGGKGWTFWQYSSTGTVPGIDGPVDLDRFNGASLTSSVLVP
ncbi:MAG TPA: GH25 family lysozyme [Candidatus Saccharimonadales bacterium]|nr:GH25 family lysozyme [Candidatus Saccharimonadales bacterium]